MKILVLNSGSSSLKYQLINIKNEELVAEGICERIGQKQSQFILKLIDKNEKISKNLNLANHKVAINLVIEELLKEEYGILNSLEEVEAVGHRVVHGGEKFNKSVIVTEKELEEIKKLSSLAPLHNPANAEGIEICMELLKGKPNVAVFDTAFHQTIRPEVYMYALPYEDYTELNVRKYGFHGTSHKYVSTEVSKIIGENKKIIVCHLGNGASVCAVKNGISVDTSMGLTPLQGLMMGTRCGDIDPASIFYIMKQRGLEVKEMDDRLNKESGLLGIFGKSSDSRDIEDGVAKGDERAMLAEDMYAYRVRAYIASYAGSLGGVDAIAFTAGIGENAASLREKICNGLEYLGLEFDKEANSIRKNGIVELSKENSRVKVFKVPTNEELVIARDTYELVK